MTDNEIIKALEICANENGMCSECAYSDNYTNCNTRIAKDALDLINRQRAEIERLKGEIVNQYNTIGKTIKQTKAEAIKEFAERLKADCPDKLLVIHFDAIDNLVKEMTEHNTKPNQGDELK